MLHIYQSNHMEQLVRILAAHLQLPSDNLMRHESILVQSPGMGTWLKIELAKINRISAGLDFPLPSSFIWNLFHTALTDVPHDNSFTKDAMTWKIMQILPHKLGDKTYQSLADYLSDSSYQGLKLYQLSHKIADVYDQYLVFRPHWILAWEQEQKIDDPDLQQALTKQPWQPDLWRELVAFNKQHLGNNTCHRANLHDGLVCALKNPQTDLSALPQQLFIFGLSSTPPQTLDILYHLAQRIDIYLFYLNPCQHYWGNIVQPKTRARITTLYQNKKVLVKDWQDLLEVGNPLLANNGFTGREFLDLLLELPNEGVHMDFDAFQEPETDNLSLLQRIQRDILNLEMREGESLTQPDLFESNDTKAILKSDDNSLLFMSCHSPIRELEILHDHLLTLLANNPDLEYRNIVVMMPDIAKYSPFIDAVFGSKQGKHFIPYAKSDRSAQDESPLIDSFLQVLSLHDSSFGLSTIIRLLEVPAIMNKFQLDTSDIDQLKRWLEKSGIRWGKDEKHREQLLNYRFDDHSWSFGLKRIILGFFMPDESDIYQDYLPIEGIEGLATQSLGGLLEFIDTLDSIGAALNTKTQPLMVINHIRTLVDKLYLATPEEEIAIQQIYKSIDTLESQLIHANFTGDAHQLDHAVLLDFFQQKLTEAKVGQRYLAGAVNFCTLMPMRAIPFQVICLLGMNSDDYPRQETVLNLDLMAHTKRYRGDRVRRFEDRYLFLEALLSARQQIYISFIGRSITNNTERLASILVHELLDYCQQTHKLETCDENTKGLPPIQAAQKSMAAVEQRLLHHAPLQPFDPRHYQAGLLQSYNAQWMEQTAMIPTDFINQTMKAKPHESELEITTLLRFYRDPCEYFFNRVLQVSIDSYDPLPDDHEPFELNNLKKYQIKENFINANEEKLERLQASGELPLAPISNFMFEKMQSEVQSVKQLFQGCVSDQQEPMLIDMHINNTRLMGRFDQLDSEGLFDFHPTTVKPKQLLQMAIRHVIVCAHKPTPTTSRIIDSKNIHTFQPIETNTAKELLEKVIHYYHLGLQSPLLLDKTLWNYAEASKKKSHDEAMQTLINQSNSSYGNEHPNLYLKKIANFPQDLGLLKTIPNDTPPYKQHIPELYQELIEPLHSYYKKTTDKKGAKA